MSEATQVSESEKKKEDWMNAKWRPLMGYMYMVVCMCDFVIFPVLWSLHQSFSHGAVSTQWQPLTLQGAGLFHMAMGAVIGVAAFGRTQEKLAGKANDNSGPSFSPAPAPSFSSPSFGNTPAPAFNSAPTTAFTPAPAPSFGGDKPKGPAFGPQPEL